MLFPGRRRAGWEIERLMVKKDSDKTLNRPTMT